MNRTQLVNEIAKRLAAQAAALPKAKIAAVLVAMQAEITDSLRRGEAVSIAGWGTWRVARRPARQVRNPANGALIAVKATSVPKWQAGTTFRHAVQAGRAPLHDQRAWPGNETVEVRCVDDLGAALAGQLERGVRPQCGFTRVHVDSGVRLQPGH